ncbi:hypothetical protein GGI12_001650 [Dipsacomyces acuminosporus]|nr:hypothetical protein GGI12_001650 [Dipsacomyces acuminosporus]
MRFTSTFFTLALASFAAAAPIGVSDVKLDAVKGATDAVTKNLPVAIPNVGTDGVSLDAVKALLDGLVKSGEVSLPNVGADGVSLDFVKNLVDGILKNLGVSLPNVDVATVADKVDAVKGAVGTVGSTANDAIDVAAGATDILKGVKSTVADVASLDVCKIVNTQLAALQPLLEHFHLSSTVDGVKALVLKLLVNVKSTADGQAGNLVGGVTSNVHSILKGLPIKGVNADEIVKAAVSLVKDQAPCLGVAIPKI